MKPPLPPFTEETARQKVQAAEDGWNERNPETVPLTYSVHSEWRNRNQFLRGRREISTFLKEKWSQERDYRLIKELFSFSGNRIAVRFAYEYRGQTNQWFRAYGNENWVFDQDGLMAKRHASINNLRIQEVDRLLRWPQGPRPHNHPTLSDLGL